jgi:uncharacterized protein
VAVLRGHAAANCADYRISAYFNDEHGVYVNLYIPSALKWEQRGAKISLTQSGQYPLDDRVSFEIVTSRPSRFALRLRIPAWAQVPTIVLNGTPISQAVRSGTFATIDREWKSGDRIELTLPRKLELKAVDDAHPNLVALVNGPLVLFAITDETPLTARAAAVRAAEGAWKYGVVCGHR